jgi:hypothetical protein
MSTLNELLSLEQTLNTPHLAKDHPLYQILDPSFLVHGVERKKEIEAKTYWGAERFHLQKTKAFTSLKTDQQDIILRRLSELNLALSYFIEKSGHHYASKMILGSETCEEKTLYALFACEEATHLRLFMNSMWFTPTLKSHYHPMLPALSEAIQYGTKNSLVFVVQVLLEGFGIAHYSGLKETCLDPELKSSFQTILKDEARHHGAGLILTKAQTIGKESEEQIFELSRKFIRSLETAHWIPGAFEFAGSPLSTHEKTALFEQMGFEETLATRMQRLKDMFHKVNYQNVFERLEKEGVFKVQSIA